MDKNGEFEMVPTSCKTCKVYFIAVLIRRNLSILTTSRFIE